MKFLQFLKKYNDKYSFLKEMEYDLDEHLDPFWSKNQYVPFPFVAEEIEKELNQWKEDYEKMGHKSQSVLYLFRKMSPNRFQTL